MITDVRPNSKPQCVAHDHEFLNSEIHIIEQQAGVAYQAILLEMYTQNGNGNVTR